MDKFESTSLATVMLEDSFSIYSPVANLSLVAREALCRFFTVYMSFTMTVCAFLF